MRLEKRTLGEVLTLKRGYDLPSQFRKNGLVPIISSCGVTDYHSEMAKTGEGVVTGRYGTLGQIFYVNGDYWPLNTTLYVQDFKDNLPKFIYYFLQTLNLKNYNSASAVPGLDRNVLHQIEINFISDRPAQRRIASILSAYDDLIENNLTRIKLLEEKAQLHYKELIHEASFTKTKREEYIKDCLAFYIGGGWGEEEYNEPFTEPAYVIRGTDIPDAKRGETFSVPFRYHKGSNLASRKMQAGDIVFEVSGGSKGQPVGRSLLITDKLLGQFKQPLICASFCKLLRTNATVTPEHFYLYLLASQENGVISQYEKHSASNIVNFGFEEFIAEQKIPIPKVSELKAVTEKVKPIFTLISTLGEQNSKLSEARDILLPKLMNGEIEV